jgi:hypothetical protein
VVDRKLLGELINLKAALAFAFPSFAHCSKRTFRAETMASSDIENTPLAIISKIMNKASKAMEGIVLVAERPYGNRLRNLLMIVIYCHTKFCVKFPKTQKKV